MKSSLKETEINHTQSFFNHFSPYLGSASDLQVFTSI